MRVIKIVSEEEAKAFFQNMRWFADMGKITIKFLENGKAEIKASPAAFSNFVWSKN